MARVPTGSTPTSMQRRRRRSCEWLCPACGRTGRVRRPGIVLCGYCDGNYERVEVIVLVEDHDEHQDVHLGYSWPNPRSHDLPTVVV